MLCVRNWFLQYFLRPFKSDVKVYILPNDTTERNATTYGSIFKNFACMCHPFPLCICDIETRQ